MTNLPKIGYANTLTHNSLPCSIDYIKTYLVTDLLNISSAHPRLTK